MRRLLSVLIGRVVCLFKGHKKGKRLKKEDANPMTAAGYELSLDLDMAAHNGQGIFYCPRCLTRWYRKAK